MLYLTIIILTLLTLISIFGGFYFGFRLATTGNFDLREEIKKVKKPGKIKDSISFNTDSKIIEREKIAEEQQEEKIKREHYGLST